MINSKRLKHLTNRKSQEIFFYHIVYLSCLYYYMKYTSFVIRGHFLLNRRKKFPTDEQQCLHMSSRHHGNMIFLFKRFHTSSEFFSNKLVHLSISIRIQLLGGHQSYSKKTFLWYLILEFEFKPKAFLSQTQGLKCYSPP